MGTRATVALVIIYTLILGIMIGTAVNYIATQVILSEKVQIEFEYGGYDEV